MYDAVFIHPFIDLLLCLGTRHTKYQRDSEDNDLVNISRQHVMHSASTNSLAPPTAERKNGNWRGQRRTHGLTRFVT